MQSVIERISGWFQQFSVSITLSIMVLALYFLIQRSIIPRLETWVERGALKSHALQKAIYAFRLLYGVVALAIILFIWGFDFKWLLALSSGIIALTGVALFASWSMLSNITAFFLLLMHDSFKRGNFIRVIETDNYIEGFIADINLFNTRLITEQRENIIYPNNLLIARPTIINPKTRYTSVGKIQEFLADKGKAPTSTDALSKS